VDGLCLLIIDESDDDENLLLEMQIIESQVKYEIQT